MKIKFSHLLKSAAIISVIGGLVTGCLSEPDFAPVVEGDGIPINLDGSISQIATKVNAQGFENGDGLGLFAVNYENSNQTPGTLKDEGNQADNVKYIFDQANWKWNPVKSVYYKDVYTNVDLYAYYPYAETSSVSAYTFEVQKDQSSPKSDSKLSGYEASDFLWAKATNIAPTETTIKMILNHKMAGVNVMLAEGDGFAKAGDWNLLDKKILVTNTTRKATIDLSTGTVTPLGGPQATGIVMCPQTDGAFRAVVVPQEIEAGTPLFSITVGGQSYNFSRPEKFTYTSGKLSNFTITINRKYPSGEYEFVLSDTQISDWKEDINTHEGDVRQYYCVHCNEPGTLGELIRADKKNPAKIKNLKVSGNIHAGDFYFMRDSMALLQSINLKEASIRECCRYNVYESGAWADKYLTKEGMTLAEIKEVYPKVTSLGSCNHINAGEIPYGTFKNKTYLANFVFPEFVTAIQESAFENCTTLTGSLIIPDDVKHIAANAFRSARNLLTLSLPDGIEEIGRYAFGDCKSLSGSLSLPNSIKSIHSNAFYNCSGFVGQLILPENLEVLGHEAFMGCMNLNGSLRIPESLMTLYKGTFQYCGFNGQLILHDNLQLSGGLYPGVTAQSGGTGIFNGCEFQGELVLPLNTLEIPAKCFYGCGFSSISGFPDNLLKICESAFASNAKLAGVIELPTSLVVLESGAFEGCQLDGIIFNATLPQIGSNAFKNNYGINKIVCKSNTPPAVGSGAFDGVPKDNFTVEVPASAVKSYQADTKWGVFKRIAAHYDFSISRSLARALSKGKTLTYILRAPANYSWSIESKPEWITVSPDHGIGKAEISVSFAEMTNAEVGTFNEEGYYNSSGRWTEGAAHEGRAGEVVFKLNDVDDYTTSLRVEQYDYQYADGDVLTLQKASKGAGVNIVLMGDCYDARDIASETYLNDIREAYGHFFAVEPYLTYKDYFNVYAVFGESSESGMGTLNTIRDAKFGSTFGENRIVQPNLEFVYEYACKAPINNNIAQSLVIMVENTSTYDGVTYMYADGSAVAICPKSADAYPYDFRGIVQHEAGGHGFGKLLDEYIYHNAFISTCDCLDGCGHTGNLNKSKNLGWGRNLELVSDVNKVGWSHLIFNPKYSNVVDVYEGGYFHSRGVYRSEPNSCMNNNIPYFSAISRQAIVERILDYAGEDFTIEKFYENDSDDFGPTTRSGIGMLPIGTLYNNGRQHAPVYMGDKPSFSNNK